MLDQLCERVAPQQASRGAVALGEIERPIAGQGLLTGRRGGTAGAAATVVPIARAIAPRSKGRGGGGGAFNNLGLGAARGERPVRRRFGRRRRRRGGLDEARQE